MNTFIIAIPIGFFLIILGIILIVHIINKRQKVIPIKGISQANKSIPNSNPYLKKENANIVHSYTHKEENNNISRRNFPNYCPYCGIKLEREAKFCHDCGSQLNEQLI